MKEPHVRSLFELVGFEVQHTWELPNGYWPESYTELRKDNPWWLVQTQLGNIEIGKRKRVWQISWKATTLRQKVTEDQVTSEDYFVHAESLPKLVEYLTSLRHALDKHSQTTSPAFTECA